ncbi:hypothetical protein [uncultured Pelagimonas sp.]|uniref:hypothetical protein n=1 Tax=uncultured Pelagimonas sp. TaxID=1618102 RepID=UPI002630CDE9|nr:hypothetical protein [uncultured Pelagimonas sp.]
MSAQVWWSEGVLPSHMPRDRFMRCSEKQAVLDWTGSFIVQSWEGLIAPTPPTQIHYARPLIGDGETPDQLDDGSGRMLDRVFGWESKYFFTHEALDFMKRLTLPEARFYDNGDDIQLLDWNGTKITEPAALFLPGALKDSVIKERSPGFLEKNSFGRIPKVLSASRLDPDGEFVVSEAALSGPTVWVEKNYKATLFFSNALKEQIDAAGLAEDFALRPVEVITE